MIRHEVTVVLNPWAAASVVPNPYSSNSCTMSQCCWRKNIKLNVSHVQY